jgi:hypothetical protein
MDQRPCFVCGQKGHRAANCPQKPKKDKNDARILYDEDEDQEDMLVLDSGSCGSLSQAFGCACSDCEFSPPRKGKSAKPKQVENNLGLHLANAFYSLKEKDQTKNQARNQAKKEAKAQARADAFAQQTIPAYAAVIEASQDWPELPDMNVMNIDNNNNNNSVSANQDSLEFLYLHDNNGAMSPDFCTYSTDARDKQAYYQHSLGDMAQEDLDVMLKVFEAENLDELLAITGQRTKVLRVALDSGAGDHVAGKADLEGFEIEASPGSKSGQHFRAANKGRLKNEGQVHVSMRQEAGSNSKLGSTFQVAEISRPLFSVSKVCDTGATAKFDAQQAVIRSKDGRVLARFKRQGGLYVAEFNTEPRAKAVFAGPSVKA